MNWLEMDKCLEAFNSYCKSKGIDQESIESINQYWPIFFAGWKAGSSYTSVKPNPISCSSY